MKYIFRFYFEYVMIVLLLICALDCTCLLYEINHTGKLNSVSTGIVGTYTYYLAIAMGFV